jgi:hypothetical protein
MLKIFIGEDRNSTLISVLSDYIRIPTHKKGILIPLKIKEATFLQIQNVRKELKIC